MTADPRLAKQRPRRDARAPPGVDVRGRPPRCRRGRALEAVAASRRPRARSIADALAEAKALDLVAPARRHRCSAAIRSSRSTTGDAQQARKPREDAPSTCGSWRARVTGSASRGGRRARRRPRVARVGEATLWMRPLSDDFIDDYLAANGPASPVRRRVPHRGAGVQLFERIEGDHFTVLGMPLLPVLGVLRERGLAEHAMSETALRRGDRRSDRAVEIAGDPRVLARGKLGIDGDYRAARVSRAEELAGLPRDAAADPDWRGCNVTMPHKRRVMDLSTTRPTFAARSAR